MEIFNWPSGSIYASIENQNYFDVSFTCNDRFTKMNSGFTYHLAPVDRDMQTCYMSIIETCACQNSAIWFGLTRDTNQIKISGLSN